MLQAIILSCEDICLAGSQNHLHLLYNTMFIFFENLSKVVFSITVDLSTVYISNHHVQIEIIITILMRVGVTITISLLRIVISREIRCLCYACLKLHFCMWG